MEENLNNNETVCDTSNFCVQCCSLQRLFRKSDHVSLCTIRSLSAVCEYNGLTLDSEHIVFTNEKVTLSYCDIVVVKLHQTVWFHLRWCPPRLRNQAQVQETAKVNVGLNSFMQPWHSIKTT